MLCFPEGKGMGLGKKGFIFFFFFCLAILMKEVILIILFTVVYPELPTVTVIQ